MKPPRETPQQIAERLMRGYFGPDGKPLSPIIVNGQVKYVGDIFYDAVSRATKGQPDGTFADVCRILQAQKFWVHS